MGQSQEREVFAEAIVQLRRAMQAAGESAERIAEAVTVLSTYERVRGYGVHKHAGSLAAAARLALARRDGRDDVTPARLAADHGAHPPGIARSARTIADTLGLEVPLVSREVARELGLRLPAKGPLRLPLPKTQGEASSTRRLIELLRANAQEARPLHEREPTAVDARAVTYVFRVTLDWKPDVWRDLELRGDQTLDDLHDAIQDAFRWDRDHPWVFFMARIKNGSGMRKSEPGTVYGHGDDDVPADVKLASFGLKTRRRFRYLFDFGDKLLHVIAVREVRKPEPRAKYPRVVGKQGKAPPQYGEW